MSATISRFAAVIASCLLAGCATARPAVPAPAAASMRAIPQAGEGGVIVAERPLQAQAPSPMRGIILAMLGDAVGTPALAQSAGGAVEFIVREADGTTLSVIQGNPQSLRPGERVTIQRDPQTTLVRAVTDAPAPPGG